MELVISMRWVVTQLEAFKQIKVTRIANSGLSLLALWAKAAAQEVGLSRTRRVFATTLAKCDCNVWRLRTFKGHCGGEVLKETATEVDS